MPVRRHRARLSFSRLRPTRWFFVFRQPLLTRDPPDPDPSDTNTKRETGRTAQLNNIAAAKVREQAHRTMRESDPSVKSRQTFPRARIRAIWAHRPPPPRALTRPSHPSSWRAGRRGHHPHHARSPLHAEDDPGRFRRCVSRDTRPDHPARNDFPPIVGTWRSDGFSRTPPPPRDLDRPADADRPALLTHAGIVLTNDGNAILREIDVTHPAAKVRPHPADPPLPLIQPQFASPHEDAPRPSDGSSTFVPARRHGSRSSPSPPIPEPTLNSPFPSHRSP